MLLAYVYLNVYMENVLLTTERRTSSLPTPETVRFLGDSLANKVCAIVLQID